MIEQKMQIDKAMAKMDKRRTQCYKTYAENFLKIKRNKVWCVKCGECLRANVKACIWFGFPTCCGQSMTVNSPGERRETPDNV